MSRRSRAAVARSAGGDRTFTALAGLVLLALGVLVVLLGAGVFGVNRARRPLLDPIVLAWIAGHTVLIQALAIAGGIVLAVVGLIGALRSARPEPRSDVLLSERPGERLVVGHAAVCDAIAADAEQIDGVSRVRVRLVGERRRPALRLSLWLVEGTDVRDVWAEIDGRVLARARHAFGVSALPTAVRLELEAAAPDAPAEGQLTLPPTTRKAPNRDSVADASALIGPVRQYTAIGVDRSTGSAPRATACSTSGVAR